MLGFVLLSVFALVYLTINYFAFVRRPSFQFGSAGNSALRRDADPRERRRTVWLTPGLVCFNSICKIFGIWTALITGGNLAAYLVCLPSSRSKKKLADLDNDYRACDASGDDEEIG